MTITLYKAAKDVQDLLDQINPETGELPDEYGSALQIAKDRAGAVAAAIVSARVHREAIKSHVAEITAQIRAEEAREQRWVGYLQQAMASTGILRILDDSGVTLVQRWPERDESIEVFEPLLIQEKYLRIKPAPPPEPDKTAIKAAIKSGLEVPGARLVSKDRIKVGL
jgi:polyhydroxyalkanoate synthesis regulator phasin